MKTFSFIRVTLIVGTLSLASSLVWFIDSATKKYNQVNESWAQYSLNESKMTDALLNLNADIGYGGMIHNFKNYIIRGDEKYLKLFNQDVLKVQEWIILLDALHDKNQDNTSLGHEQLMWNINLTVNEYKNKIAIAKKMHTSKRQVNSIDSAVKVNDVIALNTLSSLRKAIEKRSLLVQEKTDQSITNAHNFLSYGQLFSIPLIVLMIVLIYYIHEIKKTNDEISKANEWIDSLFDTSPEALICSDIDGTITRVNNQAVLLFGYNQDELLNMKIEQLVPDRSKKSHLEYRANFHKNPKLRAMGKNLDIYARLKSGEELEVDISLSITGKGKNRTAIAAVRDVSESRKVTRILKHQATHDLLTGLNNRVELEKIFSREIDRSKRYKHQLSVFMIDIDYFKSINDTYGHAFGDIVLLTFSKKLQKTMRATDLSARFGGEEFVVILPETTASNASIQAERLRKSIEEMTIKDNDCEVNITISIGISNNFEHGDDPDILLSKADEALYKAKENGRNRVELAEIKGVGDKT